MMERKLTVHVENRSNFPTLQFGGECFECGGWQDPKGRVLTVNEHATLTFEGNSFFSGVSGYVYFHTPDLTENLVVSFSLPITTAYCFTARFGSEVTDFAGLYQSTPELDQIGAGLRQAGDCAWETIDILDGHVEVRCILLPSTANDGRLAVIPDELSRRLAKSKRCRSTLGDINPPPTVDEQQGAYFERKVIVDIENQSEQTFLFDGDWFETGRWLTRHVDEIGPRETVRLEFVNDSVMSGCSGLCWYVNEGSLDTYFSMLFGNPMSGNANFDAWSGQPPAELQQELFQRPVLHTSSDPISRGGCTWKVVDRESNVHVHVVIPRRLQAMDPLAFPPLVPDQDGGYQAGGSAGSSALALKKREMGEDNDVSAMDSLLNSSRPRDALDGMGSGLKAAGAGVLAGGALFVAMPVVGAQEGGVTGFLGGVAKGTVGALGLAAGGAVAGVTQVIRGVANTPEAISQASANNKRWDTETGAWVDDATDLRGEAQMAASWAADVDKDSDEEAVFGEGGRDSSKKVVDTTFYDMVGVAPDASSVEIKKSYYKAALKVHPDKNPDDPEASNKFKALAKAYQVLSDPELRKRYDRIGKEAADDANMPAIDPSLFFGMLFGSDQFEPYIGSLYLAMQTDHIAKDVQRDMRKRQSAGADGKEAFAGSMEQMALDAKKEGKMKTKQFVREVTCASKLVERLDPWVIGRDEAGFQKLINQEASRLVQTAFGGRLLRTVGSIYGSTSDQYIAGLRGNFTVATQYAQWCDSAHSAGTRLNAMTSVAKSAYAMKQMHDGAEASAQVGAEGAEGAEAGTEETRKAELEGKTRASLEESLPMFLQAIWDVSAVDIESTVSKVCDKVLKDISIPWQLRVRRAQALSRLSRVFRDAGQVEHSDFSQSEVAKQHLEEALYGSIKEKTKK